VGFANSHSKTTFVVTFSFILLIPCERTSNYISCVVAVQLWFQGQGRENHLAKKEKIFLVVIMPDGSKLMSLHVALFGFPLMTNCNPNIKLLLLVMMFRIKPRDFIPIVIITYEMLSPTLFS